MKTLKYIVFILVVIVTTAGCTKNFDKINTNPDKSTQTTAAWLATNMLTAITSDDIASTKGFCQPFILSKYVLWSEKKEGNQYNDLGRASFGRLDLLRNVPIMDQYAQTEEPQVKNSFVALGHFIRAWQFYQTTMKVGDIPYSDAIKGNAGVIKPKYDTQKQVFLGILNELDTANTLFAKGAPFKGDFIYNGDPDKWQRLTNSFELMVLIQLYKKTSDPDLKVVQRFTDIAKNRPLMRDYNDNFAVTYKNVAGYAYPWSNTPTQINSFNIYPVIGYALISRLKALHDRRLFYYAEPAQAKITGGKTESDWDAYVGVKSSDPMSVLQNAHTSGNFCDFNKRYAELFNAEPVGLLNYWDVQFILAEGAVKGLLTGGVAEQYYEAGIKSSMKFLVNYTPVTYNHNMPLDDSYINSYIASVQLTGTKDNKIKQIITQKYLAGFLQDCDWTAWYANRRTGYPEFILNPNTNLNIPHSKFPVRWQYPDDELEYNSDNVEAAIKRQYGSESNTNGVMWILKN